MGLIGTILKNVFTLQKSQTEVVSCSKAHFKTEKKLTPVIGLKILKNKPLFQAFIESEPEHAVQGFNFLHNDLLNILVIILNLKNSKRIGIKLDLTQPGIYDSVVALCHEKKLFIMEEGDANGAKIFLDLDESTNQISQVWERSLKHAILRGSLLVQLKQHSPKTLWTNKKVDDIIRNDPKLIKQFESDCQKIMDNDFVLKS